MKRLPFTPALAAYGLLSEAIWIGLLALTPDLAYRDDKMLAVAVMTLCLVLLGACGLAWRALERPRLPGDLWAILAFTAVFVLTLIAFWQPRGSTDAAGYVFYGRAAAVYGDNAYVAVPNDHPADPIYPYIFGTWRAWSNPYGPAWTSVMAAAAEVGGARPWSQLVAFKVLAALFFFGCLALVWTLTRRTFGWPPDKAARALLLVAWNPVMLYEAVQNGHNDVAMAFFVLLTILLLAGRRTLWAAAAFSVSVLIKYVPIVALPAMAAFLAAPGVGRFPARLKKAAWFVLASTALTGATIALFWGHGELLAGLKNQAQVWYFDVINPFTFAIVTAARWLAGADPVAAMNALAKPASTVAFVLIMAFMSIRMLPRVDTPARLVRWTLVCLLTYLLLYSSWLQPWYGIWLIPLFILADDAFGYFLVSATAIVMYVIMSPVCLAAAAACYLAVKGRRGAKPAGPGI